MAEVGKGAAEVNARVVYWGIPGCGKTTNLRAVYARLRPDHRSEIREVPTRFDPTVRYEILPIELGEIAGTRTRLQIVAAPSGPEQAPTRKQLLDRVDGLVLVLDARPECMDENLAACDELRQSLAAYGRRLDDLPLVIQYNKRDLGDPYALESLYRKLALTGAPVFEAVATEGTGVLQTLSTISKRVVRSLREQGLDDAAPADPPSDTAPAPSSSARMEQAILEEELGPEDGAAADDVEATFEAPAWEPEQEEAAVEVESLGGELRIVSIGEARRAGDRRVRVPLVLADAEGRTAKLALTIDLDPLGDESP